MKSDMNYSFSYREQKALAKVLACKKAPFKTACLTTKISFFARVLKVAKDISKNKLKRLNGEHGTSIAYITAFRQGKGLNENKKRNSQMIRELQKSGVKDYYTVQGRYEEQATGEMKQEQTFLLVNPNLSDVILAANKYDQDSIIFKGKDNVIGLYNRLDNEVIIAAPGSEDVSVKRENPGKPGYDAAYTRFRSIGLNYDFRWDDPIKMDMTNPKEITVADLKKSGWLERQKVNIQDFSRKGRSVYKDKNKEEKNPRDRDLQKFLKTRVRNPETGNEVQISTLKGKPQNSQAYQYYLELSKAWKKSLNMGS